MYALRQFRLGDYMKIKLIDKKKPIAQMWCFNNSGYCSTLIDEINSGKQVTVDKIPKAALEYVEEIKTKNKGEK